MTYHNHDRSQSVIFHFSLCWPVEILNSTKKMSFERERDDEDGTCGYLSEREPENPIKLNFSRKLYVLPKPKANVGSVERICIYSSLR